MQVQLLILSGDLELTSLILKTNKDFYGTTSHFNNKYCSPNNKHAYLKVQIIEHVFNNNNQCSIADLLWEPEKY